MAEALELDNEKQVLKLYYAGMQIESPNGGFLMLLGIRSVEGGTAVAMFECSASSLRYEVAIPKATRNERKAVRDELDDGRDPDCPRHGTGNRLVRAGKNLICTQCGVAYARV